jgi:hypothetical protein
VAFIVTSSLNALDELATLRVVLCRAQGAVISCLLKVNELLANSDIHLPDNLRLTAAQQRSKQEGATHGLGIQSSHSFVENAACRLSMGVGLSREAARLQCSAGKVQQHMTAVRPVAGHLVVLSAIALDNEMSALEGRGIPQCGPLHRTAPPHPRRVQGIRCADHDAGLRRGSGGGQSGATGAVVPGACDAAARTGGPFAGMKVPRSVDFANDMPDRLPLMRSRWMHSPVNFTAHAAPHWSRHFRSDDLGEVRACIGSKDGPHSRVAHGDRPLGYAMYPRVRHQAPIPSRFPIVRSMKSTTWRCAERFR